ncbi:MAG TPA: VWA domain-containing protein [Vicinamibacterales bacterium]|nr:VWA domain-containing protein [Vicinamibacterales bacterium]
MFSTSRTRISLCSVVLAFSVVVPAAQQAPQFRTGTHNVPVYVTAIDASGHLVTDLTQDDFVLLDNGQAQAITNFANNTQPITVVVMLDRSGSVEEHFPLIEAAAAEFVQHLTVDDEARIGSFAERIQLDPVSFTSDRDMLLEIIRTELQPIGPTPLWNATNVAMTALSSQPGRRVVLVFTDGVDAPLNGRPNVAFADIRKRAEEEEIMVYGVGLVRECDLPAARKVSETSNKTKPGLFSPDKDFEKSPGFLYQRRRGGAVPTRPRLPGMPGGLRLPGGRMPPPMPLPPPRVPRGQPPVFGPVKPMETTCAATKPDPNLRTLADVSGGGYFELSKATDLASTFTRVADELHRQYLLGFVTPVTDGALHRLEVRVKRPGVQIKSRKSYLAPR